MLLVDEIILNMYKESGITGVYNCWENDTEFLNEILPSFNKCDSKFITQL